MGNVGTGSALPQQPDSFDGERGFRVGPRTDTSPLSTSVRGKLMENGPHWAAANSRFQGSLLSPVDEGH